MCTSCPLFGPCYSISPQLILLALTCLVKPSSSHVGRICLVPCRIGISGINPSRSVTVLPSGDDVVNARLVLGDQLSSMLPHNVLLPLGVVQDPGGPFP